MKETPSELEAFLRIKTDSGSKIDEGGFSLERQKAMEKLAAFQLPFQGAWLLKLVQAIVAGGCQQGIQIKLTRSVCKVEFDLPESLDYVEIEKALFNPVGSKIAHYDHLVVGLRGPALKGNRSFSISSPHHVKMLVWDGSEFSEEVLDVVGDKCVITVTHTALKNASFFSRVVNPEGRAELAALTKVLYCRCFVCPVPLTMDNKRIDTLLGNPLHGLTKSCFPYEVSWVDSPLLPSWSIPTLALALPNDSSTTFFKNFDEFMKESMSLHPPPPECSTASLLCAHFKLVESGENSHWEIADSESYCYWVDNGILVDQEIIFPGNTTAVSICVYLNAEGLEKDLTGFQLHQGPERKKRFDEAIRLQAARVRDSNFEKFVLQAKDEKQNKWLNGFGGMVAGAIFLGLKPIAVPVGLILGATSVLGGLVSDRKATEKALNIHDGLLQLQKLYADRCPGEA